MDGTLSVRGSVLLRTVFLVVMMKCYYANNVCVETCLQVALNSVTMNGKNASPKYRFVCGPCGAWLEEEKLVC